MSPRANEQDLLLAWRQGKASRAELVEGAIHQYLEFRLVLQQGGQTRKDDGTQSAGMEGKESFQNSNLSFEQIQR
eukprot:9732966-Ditylum_brightwellii.AAC.1